MAKLNEGNTDIEKLRSQGNERKGADSFDFASGGTAPPLSDVWGGGLVPEESLSKALEAAEQLRVAAHKALQAVQAEQSRYCTL